MHFTIASTQLNYVLFAEPIKDIKILIQRNKLMSEFRT